MALTLAAAFTARDSRPRYAVLPFLALIALTFPWSMARFVGTTGWIGRVPAGVTFWNIVTCFDRLIRRDWDHEHYGPTTTSNGEEALTKFRTKDDTSGTRFSGTRMEFGSEVASQARGVGLFWQVKNVPRFSDERPNMVPTRGAFILIHSISVVACYYLHNFAVETSLSLDPHLISMERVALLTRLPEVTSTEFQARVTSSLGYWVIQYSMMQFFYSAFALLSAISNPSDIYLWRPLFGSPRDAYSLRNFWGKSWHQNLRSGVEGVSDYLAHSVLQLPRHGTLQRYTKILSSFALSGLMHVFADMGVGLTMRQSGAMQFFCMQAMGIMVEDGVQALVGKRFRTVGKLVGYAWVLLFIVWTSPVWVYPYALKVRKEDAMLSFGAVKPVLGFSARQQ